VDDEWRDQDAWISLERAVEHLNMVSEAIARYRESKHRIRRSPASRSKVQNRLGSIGKKLEDLAKEMILTTATPNPLIH
jgi:hypothetical protein